MTLQSSVPRSGSQPRPRLVESSQFPSGTVAALSGASSGLSDPGRAGHCQGAEAATEGLSGSGGCNIIALLSRRPCFCFLPSFLLSSLPPFLPSFPPVSLSCRLDAGTCFKQVLKEDSDLFDHFNS